MADLLEWVRSRSGPKTGLVGSNRGISAGNELAPTAYEFAPKILGRPCAWIDNRNFSHRFKSEIDIAAVLGDFNLIV